MVIGIIEKIQGVNIARRPLPRLMKKSTSKDFFSRPLVLSPFFTIVAVVSAVFALVSFAAPAFIAVLLLLAESFFEGRAAVAVVVSLSVLPPASLTSMEKGLVVGGRHIESLHI